MGIIANGRKLRTRQNKAGEIGANLSPGISNLTLLYLPDREFIAGKRMNNVWHDRVHDEQ